MNNIGDSRFDNTEDVACADCGVEYAVSYNNEGIEVVFCPFCGNIDTSELDEQPRTIDDSDRMFNLNEGLDGGNYIDEDEPN